MNITDLIQITGLAVAATEEVKKILTMKQMFLVTGVYLIVSGALGLLLSIAHMQLLRMHNIIFSVNIILGVIILFWAGWY